MKKVIIIGAGLAGTQAAKHLQTSCEVSIYTKKSRHSSNSNLAQGGVAAAVDAGDTWQSHYQDTFTAGANHNRPDNTEILVKEGAKCIQALIKEGMSFDRDSQHQLLYGLEGAHSRHRILHSHGDQTGHYLTTFVQEQLTNVNWQENCCVTQLIVSNGICRGIIYLDENGKQQQAFADYVILAAGGVGQLYPLTTNDATITGDGISMAIRGGAKISDMEFVQFHPTLLTKNGKCYGLVSEAVRGAGAILVDENNRAIMADVHPLKDLAPRDVVARALTKAYSEGHEVFLDITAVENFSAKFPQITANLEKHNIPYETTQRIPVRPGAHFIMGGIWTDKWGQTSLQNLFAVGETACTGVHGANRLASNSLLECLVFAKRAAEFITANDSVTTSGFEVAEHAELHLPKRYILHQLAWEMLGIQRTKASLEEFLLWLKAYQFELLPEVFTLDDLETANMCLTAKYIAQAALKRTKSLGAHFRKDCESRESATDRI